MNALDQQIVKVIKHKRTEEDFKKGIIKYLELCSKHTFQRSNGDYYFIRLDKNPNIVTGEVDFYTIRDGSKTTMKSIAEDLRYCSVESLKCELKRKYFSDDTIKSVKRTKPVRKFVEGDNSIHIPEQFLQKTA